MEAKSLIKPTIENSPVALTFDDVSLMTNLSGVMPYQAELESQLTRKTRIKIPLVSAAMDTVTESGLAIELSKKGGIGIIHKNLSPEAQAREVARVKYSLHGRINKPKYAKADQTVEELRTRIREKGYKFHSFPVIDTEGKLVGIIAETDFKLCDDNSRLIREIMTRKVVTAKPDIDIEEVYRLMQKTKKLSIPLVDESGMLSGMYVFEDVNRTRSGNANEFNTDENGQLRVGAAVGIWDDEGKTQERVEKLLEERVDVLVVDTAHGDTYAMFDTIKRIKTYGDVDVVAGNVTNPESVKRLIEAGADAVKVGQGSGGICTTRVVSGVGTPQITAIYRCAKAAEESETPIWADGGVRYSGDIPKAIAAGAHIVMMGGMFAGLEETPGDTILLHERKWKKYRGMGSMGAMESHSESRSRYSQKSGSGPLVPEGVEGIVPVKGKLAELVDQYMGGLRAGMGYTGSKTIEDLRLNTRFDRVSPGGRIESHPHDLKITKDAPNYPIGQE